MTSLIFGNNIYGPPRHCSAPPRKATSQKTTHDGRVYETNTMNSGRHNERAEVWTSNVRDKIRGEDDNKPILTLRDQQEANDARTGWRPQESWDGSQLTAVKTAAAAEKVNSRRSLDIGQLAQHPRAVSDNRMNPPASRSSLGVHEPTTYPPPAHPPVSRNKTGATWDEDLPARLECATQKLGRPERKRRP